jgi:hypothetical protein
MFAVACTVTKLSMLMVVRKILASATRLWRRITLFAIIILSIQGSVFYITVIFQCRCVLLESINLLECKADCSRPTKDYWKVSLNPQPNCINQGSSLLIAGVINTLTDFLVILLPIRNA